MCAAWVKAGGVKEAGSVCEMRVKVDERVSAGRRQGGGDYPVREGIGNEMKAVNYSPKCAQRGMVSDKSTHPHANYVYEAESSWWRFGLCIWYVLVVGENK
ncbi:unnamed protein product [Sphenostylis stenocarpa]|uniref:Uncharacterized protein n=1 Tax=Sphenostylis stenocarpa TaxID=92480 RepID=A0AA86SUL4_9FABA|nr:unnamed protein product [Sphenostylis stenocarpa]